MAKARTTGQINFTIQISPRAKKSFEQLHAKLGLQKRGLTFEALLFNSALSEIVDPREIAAIISKLDHLITLAELP